MIPHLKSVRAGFLPVSAHGPAAVQPEPLRTGPAAGHKLAARSSPLGKRAVPTPRVTPRPATPPGTASPGARGGAPHQDGR